MTIDMKYIPFLILFILISCDNNEEIDLKNALMTSDWEQSTGIVDGNYIALKQFYRVSFKQNNIAEIDFDYLGVTGDPDPITITSITTKYAIDLNSRIISFPEPLDTLFITNDNVTSEIVVHFHKLRIIQLDSERLTTESLETDLQGWILGGGKTYFQPIK